MTHAAAHACDRVASLVGVPSHVSRHRAQVVWEDECLEFNGLRGDPMTPVPLQSYFRSFRLPSGVCVHAFAGGSVPLSTCSYRSFEGAPLTDEARRLLLMDLLDAVNFLHCRGSAHLGLDAEVVRVSPASALGPPRLRLIGLGAAVQLQSASGRTAYQMSNQLDFQAPVATQALPPKPCNQSPATKALRPKPCDPSRATKAVHPKPCDPSPATQAVRPKPCGRLCMCRHPPHHHDDHPLIRSCLGVPPSSSPIYAPFS